MWSWIYPSVSLSFQYRIYRSRSASNKGYMCDYDGCNRTFYQRSTLYRHQRQKHGAKHRLHPRRQSVYSLSPPYSGALNLSTNHHSASSGIKRESDGDRPGASGILGALGTSGTITPAMLKERLVTQPVSSMESLIMNLKSMQSMLPTKPELRYEQIDNLRLPLPIRDMYLSKLPHIDTFSVSPRKDGATPRGEGGPPPGYAGSNSTPGAGAGGGGPSSRLPPVASFSSASQSDPQAGGSSNRVGGMHNDHMGRNAHHFDDDEDDEELDERPMRRPPLLMPGAAADHHQPQPRSPTSSDSMGPEGPASLESSQYNQDTRNLDSSQSDMGSPQWSSQKIFSNCVWSATTTISSVTLKNLSTSIIQSDYLLKIIYIFLNLRNYVVYAAQGISLIGLEWFW